MKPLIVEVTDTLTGEAKQYAFAQSPVRLGRNPLNDISFNQPFVSQWHAVVEFDDRQSQYRDLGSTNGTTCNGQRVGQPIRLPSHERLELGLGPLEVRLWRGDEDAAQGRIEKQSAYTRPHFLGPKDTQDPSAKERITQDLLNQATATEGVSEAKRTEAFDTRTVLSIVKRLSPHYQNYRSSWDTLFTELQKELGQLGHAERYIAMGMLMIHFPDIGQEPAFAEYAEKNNLPLSGKGSVSTSSAKTLNRFLSYYLPKHRPPNGADDVEKVFGRVASILEAFSKSFLELRKGQEEFGTEMAVRVMKDHNGLNDAESVEELLTYLLDWEARDSRRIQELVSAYADIMIHQVALLNGMMEGVRSMLGRMGPKAIDRSVKQKSFLSRLWPFKSFFRWKRYRELYSELTEEDSKISSAVFGEDFARAYASIGGETYDASKNVPSPLSRGTLSETSHLDLDKLSNR